jgi:hypothetical protein
LAIVAGDDILDLGLISTRKLDLGADDGGPGFINNYPAHASGQLPARQVHVD